MKEVGEEFMGDRNQTSFAAELFVAAELAKQGHLVTITWGNEKAIDLLVAKAGNSKKTVSVVGNHEKATKNNQGGSRKKFIPKN